MLIDICIKFREYSLSGFQVIEQTRFVTDRGTDRRTDRQTDRRPGKNNMSPDPKGGRHNNNNFCDAQSSKENNSKSIKDRVTIFAFCTSSHAD